MQLNRFSDYALRVLMFVAQRQGAPVTIADIARAHAISEHHLMKVVSRLGQAGYLATSRGRGGGIALGRPAEKISIGALVRELEPLNVVECMADGYGGRCRLSPRCALTGVIREALGEFLKSLDKHTLADIT